MEVKGRIMGIIGCGWLNGSLSDILMLVKLVLEFNDVLLSSHNLYVICHITCNTPSRVSHRSLEGGPGVQPARHICLGDVQNMSNLHKLSFLPS